MMNDPKKVAEMQKLAEDKLAEGEKLLQEAEKAKEGEAMSIEEIEAKIATLEVGSEERTKLKKKLKKKKFLKAKKEREQNDIIDDVPEM
jgi:elongation factor P--beta-lysine ligase